MKPMASEKSFIFHYFLLYQGASGIPAFFFPLMEVDKMRVKEGQNFKIFLFCHPKPLLPGEGQLLDANLKNFFYRLNLSRESR